MKTNMNYSKRKENDDLHTRNKGLHTHNIKERRNMATA